MKEFHGDHECFQRIYLPGGPVTRFWNYINPRVTEFLARTHELIRLYGAAIDATLEHSFVTQTQPRMLKGCIADLRNGRPISVDNIRHQGELIRDRAQ